MNLLLLLPDELRADQSVRLSGRRALHLLDVLRVEVGQEVRVGVVRGPTGTARVQTLTPSEVTLTTRLGPEPPPLRPAVDVVLALPRPKVLSRVLQCVASFGVGRVDLVNAWRVPKSYFDSDRLSPERLARDLWLGCEQGATTWVPEVQVHRLFLPLVEGELTRRVADGEVSALVAHPHEQAPIEHRVPASAEGRILIAIGPEGGWIDDELGTFVRAGFAPVKFSERVLRVEAALPAVLGQLELLRRLASI